jgi:uncharacterized membrane protein
MELIKRPHAALVHIPISLYPVSFIFLAMHYYQDNPAYLIAAFWCFMFAVISIIPIVATGFLDMARLKFYSREGDRLLKMHLVNGILITILSLGSGWYFYQNQPMLDSSLIASFWTVVALLSVLVMAQGVIAAIMIYQHHIGIDGETR